MSCPVSIEHPVLCKLLRPAVLLHLAAPKITQNGGQTWARVGRLQTPLEARAVGARLSAFGAKRASLFLLKRGWNVCWRYATKPKHFPKREKVWYVHHIAWEPRVFSVITADLHASLRRLRASDDLQRTQSGLLLEEIVISQTNEPV